MPRRRRTVVRVVVEAEFSEMVSETLAVQAVQHLLDRGEAIAKMEHRGGVVCQTREGPVTIVAPVRARGLKRVLASHLGKWGSNYVG